MTDTEKALLELVDSKLQEAIDETLEEWWSRPTRTGGLNDSLITSPEMMRLWALTVIKSKWGIRNPPPWLICAYTGESYTLG